MSGLALLMKPLLEGVGLLMSPHPVTNLPGRQIGGPRGDEIEQFGIGVDHLSRHDLGGAPQSISCLGWYRPRTKPRRHVGHPGKRNGTPNGPVGLAAGASRGGTQHRRGIRALVLECPDSQDESGFGGIEHSPQTAQRCQPIHQTTPWHALGGQTIHLPRDSIDNFSEHMFDSNGGV